MKSMKSTLEEVKKLKYYNLLQQQRRYCCETSAAATVESDSQSFDSDSGSCQNYVIMSSSPPNIQPSSLVTPVPSSSSSVTSSSGGVSGSESDASSLAAAAAANANRQAAAMAAAAQAGIVPTGPYAALFSNPHLIPLMNQAGVGLNAATAGLVGAASEVSGFPATSTTPTPHHPIAEFLYQLTKMLTDDNSEIIEWKNGRIFVHDPHRLGDEVLRKYFRHSKYASFQRQLNYFGFKKIAGKGKMSPCSYVNESATDDIRSLLFIKRKTATASKLDGKNGGAYSKAGKKRKAATTGPGFYNNPGKKQGYVGTGTELQQLPFAVSQDTQHQNTVSSQQAAARSSSALQLSYAATLAQQQALMTAQQPSEQAPLSQQQLLSQSPYAPLASATAALKSSETFHFPNEASMRNLISAGQHQQQQQQSLPCPATLAMNASNSLAGAGSVGATGGNIFGSANLTSLLNSTEGVTGKSKNTFDSNLAAAASSNPSTAPISTASSSAFLSSLPSSNTLFPENFSSISLNRLLNGSSRASVTAPATSQGSAGRIPSMLGLNGLLSRENSLLDLAMCIPNRPSAQALQALGMYMEPNPLPDGDAAAQILG